MSPLFVMVLGGSVTLGGHQLMSVNFSDEGYGIFMQRVFSSFSLPCEDAKRQLVFLDEADDGGILT